MSNDWTDPDPQPQGWLDGDLTALLASLCFHLALLVGLGLIPFFSQKRDFDLALVADPVETVQPELDIPQAFMPSDLPTPEIGALSVAETDVAQSLAPIVAEIADIPSPVEIEPVEVAYIDINHALDAATGLMAHENLKVRGAMGQGERGVSGAIDRLTQEILMKLEERKTLVVWLFDQSGSLHRQRQQIRDRLDRIYEELGVIEAAGNEAFAKHYDKPLLTTVAQFGSRFNILLEESDNLAEIQDAVAQVTLDDTGEERVFVAVQKVANEYRRLRDRSRVTGEPQRNVMIVVVSDEAGDDPEQLDATVRLCRSLQMGVYVVGVPAPFGQQTSLVKWVDPDPNFDQSPRWGEVSQGPESFMLERVRLAFAGDSPEDPPMDSGFGPFALTRLCFETGGIYFAIHPNRNVNRSVGRRETEPFSAHMAQFFDPELMRRYRPDYVSTQEYLRRARDNDARFALLQAAQLSMVTPLENPRLRFIKRDEATFSNELTEAQKGPAKLEPQLERMYSVLKDGEAERDKEFALRWQAGYDLAMGRTLATLIRTQTYNAVLAQAKRGMQFKDNKSNTWVLKPSDQITVNSKLAGGAERAREYLQQVVERHPGTPWAFLAQRELKTPLGWEWMEEFTDLSPPPRRRPGNNNNNNNPRPRPPRDQQPDRSPPKPPRRPVPKL